MRRFYVPPASLTAGRVSIDGALAHRLTNVLRLGSGDEVTLFDGRGDDMVVRLDSLRDGLVTGEIVGHAPGSAESPVAVHLYQSITKGDRFEWLLEKATELGVARVVPLNSARSVVRAVDGRSRSDRWRRIVIEAAEQCGRGVVPEIAAPSDFADAVGTAPGIVLLPYEGADDAEPSIGAALAAEIDALFALAAVSIFIGPEGGYEPGEVALARSAGAIVVTLGRRVLRSETAGIVAATLVMQASGELG